MGKTTRYVTPTDHEISERMAMAVSNYEMGMLGIEGGILSSAVAGAFVTAGIAASDVICGVKQGKYVKGDDHSSAITLLKEVDVEAGNPLPSCSLSRIVCSMSLILRYLPMTKSELKERLRSSYI